MQRSRRAFVSGACPIIRPRGHPVPLSLEDLAGGQVGAVPYMGIFGIVNGGYCEKNERVYVGQDRTHILDKGRNLQGWTWKRVQQETNTVREAEGSRVARIYGEVSADDRIDCPGWRSVLHLFLLSVWQVVREKCCQGRWCETNTCFYLS